MISINSGTDSIETTFRTDNNCTIIIIIIIPFVTHTLSPDAVTYESMLSFVKRGVTVWYEQVLVGG